MAKLLLKSASVATAAVGILPGESDWTQYTFEQYNIDFLHAFDQIENVDRGSIFRANLALVNEHNADPAKTWFAAVNEFTAWTNDEFRQKRAHGTRSDRSTQDSRMSTEFAASQTPPPDSVDWRTKAGVVTPVKNQGSCGSCWAFSATETMESALAIATGKAATELSPQQIVSCAPNPQKCGGTGGCDGSTQELAFQYTEAGLTSEADYPYTQVTGTCEQSKIKPVAKNGGFVKLPANNYTALVAGVAEIGPIAISVAAGAMGWQIYGGGVYGGKCGWDQDHAVQLVGYGTDGGKGYWTVRNSWGAGWGEKGYIRIQRKRSHLQVWCPCHTALFLHRSAGYGCTATLRK